jgi:tRNA (guanine-N7-)-methyltransferase
MPKAGSPGRRPISRISSEPNSEVPHRRKHYGRRKGPKLRGRQAGLLETLLPQLTLVPQPGRDPREYFSVPGEVSEVWLEIGFGAGEHLAWQAAAHPEVGLIGAEPYVAGMAKLLSKIDSSGIANVRLYTEDARDIITSLPDASLARVFILFADPWPKTRHHKRRFIQMEMLDQLARVMKATAELRFATDDAGYLVWALERLCAHRAFAWTARAADDWRVRPEDWPETRYEAKAIRAGRACTYLRFVRA